LTLKRRALKKRRGVAKERLSKEEESFRECRKRAKGEKKTNGGS